MANQVLMYGQLAVAEDSVSEAIAATPQLQRQFLADTKLAPGLFLIISDTVRKFTASQER